jgi:Predicted endonuclease containing a URI domain
MSHYVYLLECADERRSFYIGYTTDVGRRVREHNRGEGAKYTRGRTPVTLRYVERWESKSEAMSREWELKQRTRRQKEDLVPEEPDRVAFSL